VKEVPYFLAIFKERIGETEVVLAKIVKARDIESAKKLADKDAEENSCYDLGYEAIRELESLEEIKSIEDIPIPFMIKE